MNRLEEVLGYQFKNAELLKEAVSHPSLSSEARPAPPDNQRLEYLGDAVLELIISCHLFHTFPECQEGPLTKLRASIVSRAALAKVGKRLELGRELLLSRGEESSGGRSRASNLADTVEAILGAVYLDGGFEAARDFVLRHMKPELSHLDPSEAHGNTKGALQEILQAVTPEAPTYSVLEENGPPHDRTYLCQVSWLGEELGRGTGPSKKVAESRAAAAALKQERWKTPRPSSYPSSYPSS